MTGLQKSGPSRTSGAPTSGAPTGGGRTRGERFRGGPPRRLRLALNKVMKGPFAKRGFSQTEILSRWPTIVGPMLAQHSCPERLTFEREKAAGANLLVRVEGAFGLELQHLAPQVIDRINTYFGYRAVARLSIVQGPIPRQSPRPRAAARGLSPAEEKSVVDAVAATRDPELAQALAALGRAVVAASPTEPAPSGADGATDSPPDSPPKHAEAPEVL